MSFVKKQWESRVSDYPNRRKLTDTTSGTVQTVNVARDEGNVSSEGDAFSAANMNGLENRIDNAFKNEHKFLTQTLAAESTLVDFTDESITSDCIPHVYVPIEKNKLVPDRYEFISPHTLRVFFPAVASSTVIKLKIEKQEA